MIRTKSDTMRLVRQGRSIEVFHHAVFGYLNVTAVRKMIAEHPDHFPVYRCAFLEQQVQGVDLKPEEVTEWLIAQREVCPARCAELTDAQLEEPLINAISKTGEAYIIDGIHRFAVRYRRGMPDFGFYAFPLELVPRIDPRLHISHQWGEKEVRDGKLVKVRGE